MSNETIYKPSEPQYTNVLGSRIKCVSWSLEYNAHLTLYEDAKDYYNGETEAVLDYSKEIYDFRIYEYTPVGFVHIVTNDFMDIHNFLKDYDGSN